MGYEGLGYISLQFLAIFYMITIAILAQKITFGDLFFLFMRIKISCDYRLYTFKN